MNILLGKSFEKTLRFVGVIFLLGMLFILLFLKSPYVNFASAAGSPTPITKKVLVLNFDPYISGTTPLTVSRGWGNPLTLQTQYITDVKNASHNYVNYTITQTQTIRDYPFKTGGFKFTNAQYLGCLTNSSPSYCLQLIDYQRLINDYNLCGQVNSGTIDEVWLWGGPYFGYYESIMAGPNAFNTNAPPLTGTSCTKSLHIMGFSYERSVAEMLHNLGHRVEGTMKQVYGGWAVNFNTPWNRFSMPNKDMAGKSACGNVHFPANGTSDYDYGNTTSVNSRCDDFLNYPSTTGAYTSVNCSAWGCNQYGFMKYWLTRLPYKTALTNNKLNNWWSYVVDYDSAIQPVSYSEKWYAVETSGNDYYTSCGQTITNSNELYQGVNPGCSTNNFHTTYLKFPNVQIPRNSYITSAYVEFVADGTFTNPLTESITISDGTTTSSGVTWNIADTWNFYTLKQTPSLTSAIQQLVNSASWSSGREITVKISHVSGTGQRRFFAFDREGNAGARLVVVVQAAGPSLTPTPTPTPSPTPTPAVVIFYPTADSYVFKSPGTMHSNFGTSPSLIVDGSPGYITYMKFDLTSLVGRNITSAVLKVKVTDGSVSTQNLKQTSTSWSETGITFNNRPAFSTTITSFSGTAAGTWKDINLTSWVNANKGSVVSFGIDSSGFDNVVFYSRNAALTADRPYIEVR